jgi:hypothetical protein
MVMDWHNTALATAGAIGSAIALVHGALTQRYMVEPLTASGREPLPGRIRRIVPALLHFSTFTWFVGGLVLLAAAFVLEPQARLVASLLVASSYLYGAAGNLWATRGRHPGWALYTVALLLIGYGLSAR